MRLVIGMPLRGVVTLGSHISASKRGAKHAKNALFLCNPLHVNAACGPTPSSGPAAAGSGGNTLSGNDASDPDSGQDVFIRAGSVRDPFTLMGLPGTTFIQGSTNGVSAKQGGIVISTTGGSGPDALSGGDITIQSGNGGAMGGEPGYVRILAGAAQGLIGPQFLIGNATASTLIQSDGTNLVMSHAGGRFAIMASTEESTRWLVIQDQSTTLILSNGTVSVDGNLCVDGQPTSGQVPVFTKGFCTGFVTP